jgi:hypothetical protein
MSEATFKKVLTVAPVAWARRQDLLQRDACFMAYEAMPAAENGHEPMALYTEDQLLHELQRLLETSEQRSYAVRRWHALACFAAIPALAWAFSR